MLFSPYRLNGLHLPNRIVMAPTTWSRTQQPGDVPTALNAAFYSQRASAGLIVTEAIQVSSEGNGFTRSPGINGEDEQNEWRLITNAVHAAGGRIFVQLWHAGQVSNASFQSDGRAPPALPARDTGVLAGNAGGPPKAMPADKPRFTNATDIPGVVEDFRHASRLAMQAGFDGVEIHGGSGNLTDQFPHTATNRRSDHYCGSIENRVRFLAEVTRAVVAEVGSNRTGVRLAPCITFKDIADPEVADTILAAADVLEEQEITYIHFSEPDFDGAPYAPDSLRAALRKRYANTIIVAARYDYMRALQLLHAGHADLVAFDRPSVANSDLPRRLRDGLPLAKR
jgi:N-ethylmaleimide reductase